MPDELMPDGTEPLAAITDTLSEIERGIPPAPEAAAPVAPPPATVSAAPTPASSAASAAATPSAAGTAPQGQPPAAGTPPAQAPDKMEQYVRTLTDQNRVYAEGLQQVLQQQKLLMDKVLQQEKPEMTPEQRQARIGEAFKAINEDPEAFVQGQIKSAMEQTRKEFEGRFAARDPQMEGSRAAQDHLARLYSDPSGRVVRPEMSDPEFFREMISPDTQKAVVAKYYPAGTPPQVIANDPGYYHSLYMETRFARAERARTQPPVAAPGDLTAQRAVLQAHGAPPADGAGRTPGAAPKADPDAEFKASLVNLGANDLNSAFSKAKWEGGPRR